jgi:hypothetical protein
MLAVLVRMTPEAQVREFPTAALAEDVIWAAAEPQDCLEHLTVEVAVNGLLSIMAFVRASGNEHAVAQVGRLMARALQRAQPLSGWSVAECSATNL